MPQYYFRFPADTPELTYDGLAAYVRKHWRLHPEGWRYAPVGRTVTIHERRPGGPGHEVYDVYLYRLRIARLTPNAVSFGQADDGHLATREWLARIVADNGLGSTAWRIRRHKSDGPGPAVARGQAGLLVIDGDRSKPVHGQVYTLRKEAAA